MQAAGTQADATWQVLRTGLPSCVLEWDWSAAHGSCASPDQARVRHFSRLTWVMGQDPQPLPMHLLNLLNRDEDQTFRAHSSQPLLLLHSMRGLAMGDASWLSGRYFVETTDKSTDNEPCFYFVGFDENTNMEHGRQSRLLPLQVGAFWPWSSHWGSRVHCIRPCSILVPSLTGPISDRSPCRTRSETNHGSSKIVG
jgi:hypothetical protein